MLRNHKRGGRGLGPGVQPSVIIFIIVMDKWLQGEATDLRVRGGHRFAELPNWEGVLLKSGTESEVPECSIRSVSSLQYDCGNSQPKP